MDEVVAYGVAPVLTSILRWIGLVKEMVAALPEAQSVGVVEIGFGVDVVVDGAVWIAGVRSARLEQALHQRIGGQRFLLFGQGVGEGVVRDL